MKRHCLFAALLALAISQLHAEPMNFEILARQAEQLSKEAYKTRQELQLPPMQYDQFSNVLFRPERTVWKKEELPFQLQFFPVGWIHKKGVTVYEIVDGNALPMPIDTEMFSHAKDKNGQDIQLPNAISGFRVHSKLITDNGRDEFLVFMGASYFRALANTMGYGISARGIALNTAHPDGEEFPDFTTFWVQRPKPEDTTVTIYALMDGPSCTGAYQMVVSTGSATSAEVTASLFMRRKVSQLGIAPLTSMFWYGENSYPKPHDYRPEVHDSDGLLIGDANGEWIWRPLLLSPAVRHCTFATNSLKGYGLFLRDRDPANYQDLGVRYETRPSLWVEPLNPWQGRVHLVELPTDNEYMDNIVAFWEPANNGASRHDLKYRLTWLRDDPQLSPLARVTATRRTAITYKKQFDLTTSAYEPFNHEDIQEFVVDFSAIEGVPCDEQHKPEVAVEFSRGAELIKSFVVANPNTGGWRAFAQLRFKEKGLSVDLSLKLLKDKKVASERWSYLWQP